MPLPLPPTRTRIGRPTGRKTSRRALLAGAAAAVAFSACARPERLLATFGVPTPLHVHIVGLPAEDVSDLGAALAACHTAYEKAGRGLVSVRITTGRIPDLDWYLCTPPPMPPAGCPPGASPASSVQVSAETLILGGATGASPPRAQIATQGTRQLLVRGRTRLHVEFGDGALLPPVINPTLGDWPDIIVAYDLWQYWLVPLAVDLAEQWKTTSDDRQGLPGNFERYARFFASGRGTFVSAFPLLRNPMMLFNFDPGVTPWTWLRLIAALKTSKSRTPWVTTLFSPSRLFPEATETGAATVVAFGGRLGTTTPERSEPDWTSSEADAGVKMVSDIVSAGLAPDDPTDTRYFPVIPQYMWNAFGGASQPFSLLQPLPAGPARTAVPCTYLCATVVSRSQRVQQAQDFASFLMHSASQTELARWMGGLPLRVAHALPEVRARFPKLSADLAEQVASGANDLAAPDLSGGEKTVANAATYNGVADGFVTALGTAVGSQPAAQATIQKMERFWRGASQ